MGGIFGGGGSGQNNVDPVAAGLRVQTSAYGLCLPLVYGRTRVSGNLIWFGDFTPIAHTTTQSGGGKGGGAPDSSNTSWTYLTSFAIGLGEGQINQIYGGWRDKEALTLAQINAMFTTFTGTLGQTPWSYLTANHAAQAIGYSSVAYMAAANYDLGSNSSLPNHSFELGGKFSATSLGATKTVTFPAPTLGSAIAASVSATQVQNNMAFMGFLGYGLSYALNATAGSLVAGDIVQLQTTGVMPANFSALTDYVVLGMKGTVLSLSTSLTAKPIALINTGTGTLTIKKKVYSATLASTAHGIANDVLINLVGSPPAPFVAGNDYYVVNSATNALGLATTIGGTAIAAGAAGSCTMQSVSIGGNPRDIVVDILTAQYAARFPTTKLGDLSDYSAFCVASGLFISPAYSDQNPAQQMVMDLMQITNGGIYFSEGLLKITPLSDTNVSGNGANYYAPNAPLYDLTDDDYIVSGATDPVKMNRNSQADANNQIQVEFLNSLNDFNVEISEARDQAAVDTYGLFTKDPITAHAITDAATARTVAQMILQRSLYVRNTYEFTLSWKYCLLEPTDILTITDSGLGLDKYAVRVTSIEETDTGEFNIIAEDYPAGVSHSAIYPSAAGVGWSVDYNASGGSVVAPAFFEVPSTSSLTGLAIGVAVTGNSPLWGGCEVWSSFDGSTYKKVGVITGGARYGLTTNTVTSAAGQVQNVALAGNGGQLIAASAGDAGNLATLSLIEDEYLAFTGASLISSNNYGLTLSNRAQKQTVAAAHTSGKKFIRMDNAVFIGDDLSLDNIGKTLHFKFRSYNVYQGALQALADAAVVDYTYTITGVMAKLPPTDVASITYMPDVNGLTFNWTDIADGDRLDYELRKGATWATATSLGFYGSNNAKVPPQGAGTNTYQVRARDKFFNYSNNSATVSVVITAPSAPTVTSSIIGAEFKLAWNIPTSISAIDHYEIRTGATWAGGTYVGTSGGQTYQAPVNFGGSVNFMVAAVDSAGNVGTAGAASVTITNASAVTLTTQVVDNNVLFYWNDTHGTLPIKTWELRKGATFSTAAVIGTKSGLFTTVFETAAGNFTYWVVPIDTAGNYGTEKSIGATVSQPPDYVLQADFNSTFTGTLSNARLDTGGVSLPLNTSETFAGHFSSRSWATLAAQVAAGFNILAEPAQTTGYYEEMIDYGTTFATCKITLSASVAALDGSPTVSYQISTSPDNVTYTAFSGTQVYGTNFRYVKIRITATSAAGHDLAKINNINVKLDIKLHNDAGSVAAVSTDNSAAINSAAIGGTTVMFGTAFINVTSITLSPQGTTPLTAIYDFIGSTVNPLGFKVYLFNAAGTRVSGTVSWTAKGY